MDLMLLPFFLKSLSDRLVTGGDHIKACPPVPWSPASQALLCWSEEEKDILKDFFHEEIKKSRHTLVSFQISNK